MKYYSEEETKDLRLAFEDKILRWAKVTKTKMFGCPCYQVKGKLFVFLVTKGIVITQLQTADRIELSNQQQTTFFQAGKKTIKNWLKLPIENREELDDCNYQLTDTDFHNSNLVADIYIGGDFSANIKSATLFIQQGTMTKAIDLSLA